MYTRYFYEIEKYTFFNGNLTFSLKMLILFLINISIHKYKFFNGNLTFSLKMLILFLINITEPSFIHLKNLKVLKKRNNLDFELLKNNNCINSFSGN